MKNCVVVCAARHHRAAATTENLVVLVVALRCYLTPRRVAARIFFRRVFLLRYSFASSSRLYDNYKRFGRRVFNGKRFFPLRLLRLLLVVVVLYTTPQLRVLQVVMVCWLVEWWNVRIEKTNERTKRFRLMFCASTRKTPAGIIICAQSKVHIRWTFYVSCMCVFLGRVELSSRVRMKECRWDWTTDWTAFRCIPTSLDIPLHQLFAGKSYKIFNNTKIL